MFFVLLCLFHSVYTLTCTRAKSNVLLSPALVVFFMRFRILQTIIKLNRLSYLGVYVPLAHSRPAGQRPEELDVRLRFNRLNPHRPLILVGPPFWMTYLMIAVLYHENKVTATNPLQLLLLLLSLLSSPLEQQVPLLLALTGLLG